MILVGDCVESMRSMANQSVHCCITSPPYFGLRDYGHEQQIGLELTPDEYVRKMVEVFREVRRVLRDDGTLWLNLGDSYAARVRQTKPETAGTLTKANKGILIKHQRPLPQNFKEKDLIGVPWRVAFALQADGWYLRQDIIWHKPNPMPESVRDRCTKAHEYIFLMAKSERYYFDSDSIRQPLAKTTLQREKTLRGRSQNGGKSLESLAGYNYSREGLGNMQSNLKGANKRSVWTITTKPFKGAHFATFPPELIEPCVLAGCPENGIVFDPFGGSGTTGVVAVRHNRSYILCELNREYAEMARHRIREEQGLFADAPL